MYIVKRKHNTGDLDTDGWVTLTQTLQKEGMRAWNELY